MEIVYAFQFSITLLFQLCELFRFRIILMRLTNGVWTLLSCSGH